MSPLNLRYIAKSTEARAAVLPNISGINFKDFLTFLAILGPLALSWYHIIMNFNLGIKWRSLPNDRTYRKYLNAYMVILANYLGVVFIHFCLIAKDLVPLSPTWLLVVLPFVTIYEYLQIESRFKEVTRDDFKNLLTDLRQGQLQSFKEKLEERPEYLKSQYQGKTLLHWCKKYQNLKANKIIIDQMRDQIRDQMKKVS